MRWDDIWTGSYKMVEIGQVTKWSNILGGKKYV